MDAKALHDRLAWLVELYNTKKETRVPEQPYRVVFGPAALATFVEFLGWIGYSGDSMKRGYGMFQEDDIGKQVMSEQFTLMEDPALLNTFAQPVDTYDTMSPICRLNYWAAMSMSKQSKPLQNCPATATSSTCPSCTTRTS